MYATCYNQLAQSFWPRWKSAHEWALWIWIQECHCTCEIAINTPTPPHSASLSPSIALPPHLLCGCALSPSLRRSVYKVKAALKWLSLWFILFFLYQHYLLWSETCGWWMKREGEDTHAFAHSPGLTQLLPGVGDKRELLSDVSPSVWQLQLCKRVKHLLFLVLCMFMKGIYCCFNSF